MGGSFHVRLPDEILGSGMGIPGRGSQAPEPGRD